MTVYGYARVSALQQDLTTQENTLKGAGAEHIVAEKRSGKDLNRDGLQSLLKQLQAGDTLIVTKMDRLARNVQEGISLIDELTDKGITLQVLNMGTFDSSPTSKLIRNILLSVADWERHMMLERQQEALESRAERGLYKTKPMTYTKKHAGMNHALELLKDRKNNGYSVQQICEMTSVGRTSLYKRAREQGIL